MERRRVAYIDAFNAFGSITKRNFATLLAEHNVLWYLTERTKETVLYCWATSHLDICMHLLVMLVVGKID